MMDFGQPASDYGMPAFQIIADVICQAIGPFAGEREYFFRAVSAPIHIRATFDSAARSPMPEEGKRYRILLGNLERDEDADYEDDGRLMGQILALGKLDTPCHDGAHDACGEYFCYCRHHRFERGW